MDSKYDVLFQKDTLFIPNTKTPVEFKDFKKKVESVLLFENKLHNFIKFSTILGVDATFSFTEFSDYFAKIIYKYKENQDQLSKIREFLYKVLSPLYSHSKFIEHFSSSQSLYTKKDDILYVVNTTKEILSAIKIEDLSHNDKNKNVYIFGEDSSNSVDDTLTVDSLTIFSVVYLLLNIHPLTQNNANKYIQISNSELASVFQKYLDKKMPNAIPKSIIAFALENAPTMAE